MTFCLDWTIADIALLVAVTVMGVTVAYLRDPEHKATVLMLPVPFSLAMFRVGRPIEAANVLAIPSLFGYTFLVWLLHARLQLPILAAIVASASCYCLAGMAITRSGLTGGAAFWTAAAVISGLIEIKHLLGGFTTMFPMVGVVASYESRHSLWTIVRRIAWLLVLMPPMMAAIRLLQPHVGTPTAVVLAWPVFLTGLWLWHRGAS